MNTPLPEHLPEKLLKPYNPEETEARIYKKWEESGFFNPDVCVEKGITDPEASYFSIILPPPNVTGVLHMGHALGLTAQDILVRYHRMKGDRTLWLPGTDHAAIATQSKVEKEIQKKEGKSRHDLGREELLKRIDTFAEESHDTIVSQMKAFGASLDWSREAFTLDEQRNFAVRTVFKKMYDDGLIYRGFRIVNWDPKGQTTISDDEIVYEERKATLYTFKYSKDFPIAISTTRLETKVGDTAVAVHPDDPRYKEFVGKEYDAEFCGVPIHVKIIADKEVDPEFGTGALGVTPAHSQTDWAIAERHGLKVIPVINEYAKMTVGDERIFNKKTIEAREAVAEWLRSEGLMIEEKEINQNVSTAERTGGIVEPLPKLQWFVAVNNSFILQHSEISGIPSGSSITLKELMRKSVEEHQIEIIPEHYSKTYFHWIDNLNDWCISRQIWYGHRIPVWYKKNEAGEEEVYCDIVPPENSEKEKWIQDSDTLDTWFSSALWTFSTLGWPEHTQDLRHFHPTSVLVTAYEILFFWVARMILMTGYVLGSVPFQKVYLTGIVRDNQGRKLSKSLGNGIDPIEVSKKFGSDAGRMALIVATAPGTDSKISEDKIKGYKNFANKLWNITRFVLSNCEDFDSVEVEDKASLYSEQLNEKQKAQLVDFAQLIQDVTNEMETMRFHLVAEKLYQYVWHTFADIILEESKIELQNENKKPTQWFLLYILQTSLKMLHPFIPFVTEELWSLLPGKEHSLLMVETWPQ